MPNNNDAFELSVPGSWAKKYFLASRALMEAVLRPFDLGNTQWYVLYRLSEQKPVGQRHVTSELEVERATLSAVIAVLSVAFGGVDPAEIATMNRVLSGATERLILHKKEIRS